jgi:ABC-type glycerol-3-phosphate transport system substrate-binding protein
VALLACSTIVAVASGAATTKDTAALSSPTTINVAICTSPSATALEAIAPTFTRETGIKVNFISVPYNDETTKLLLNAKAHSGTWDIAQYDKPFQAAIVAGGGLMPLDSMIKANPSYGISDFPSAIRTYQEYDGTTYGLDLSTEPGLEFYRTDLFKKAGIAGPPKTWSQYMADAKALTTAGIYGSGFGYSPGAAAYWFSYMLYESGGRLLAPNTNKSLLTTPVVEQAMTQYVALAKDTPADAIPDTSGSAQITAFEEGSEAQVIDGSGWYSDISNPTMSKVTRKFAVAALPTAKLGTYPVDDILSGWLIGIPTYAANKAAAEQFLMFALGKGEVQAFLSAGAPPPGRTSTLTNAKYIKENKSLPALLAAEKAAIPGLQLPQSGQIMTDISVQISAMVAGQTSVSAGLAKANSQVTQLLSAG